MIELEKLAVNIVDKLLNHYKLHFISYIGGSGGEFLISNISKYSDLYNKNLYNRDNNIIVPNDGFVRAIPARANVASTNRTSIDSGLILSSFLFLRQQTSTISELKNFLVKRILTLSELDLQYELDYILPNLSTVEPTLIKTHIPTNHYFTTGNTWEIMLDDHESFNYVSSLRFIKIFNNEVPTTKAIMMYEDNIKSVPALAKRVPMLWQYLKDNNIEHIKEMYINALCDENISKKFNHFKSTNDFIKFLECEPIELYHLWAPKWDEDNTNINNNRALGKNKINLSRMITEKSYIESMFGITNSNFYAELQIWHRKNKSLIKAAGLDKTQF